MLSFAAAVCAGERQSVTFVLAADTASPGYFSAATAYYREQPEQSGPVVTAARSLAEVREFLQRSPLRGERPWGQIRLVVHGSQWYGLRVLIFPDGPWTTPGALVQVVADRTFPTLPNEVLDAASEIVVESCGIGARADLLASIARLFSGTPDGVRTQSSRGYVVFRQWRDGFGNSRSQREEIPYVYRVVPFGGDVSDRAVDRLAPQWRAQFGDPPGELRVNRIPIVLQFPVPSPPVQLRKLLTLPAVAASLHDLGIARHDLSWDRFDAQLRGRATLLVLAPGEADTGVQPLMLAPSVNQHSETDVQLPR